MRRSIRRGLACLAAVAILGPASVSLGALLGDLLGFPQIFFESGTTTISGGTLSVNSAPIALRLSAGAPPIFINPSGNFETVAIEVQVDGACNLVGGAGGDDFLLFGEVDLGGGDVRSGTLLTGEVLLMGFLDAGPTDLFDFRFDITGGLLADQFGLTEDLGVVVTSENSTFEGNCGADSTGQAKGAMGSIPPILPAEGCTPGYWKQKHHFDSWVGFAPTDSFDAVFGRSVAGITDLESALKAGGGGVKALVRHATAALLNAANPDVNAEMAFDTTAEVIAAFQAAFDSGDYEPTKNLFEASNENGCPLN